MKRKLLCLTLLTAVVLSIFTACGTKTAETTAGKPSVNISVSAAASLTESLTAIAEKYKEKAPNVTISYNFASSGALQTQIEQGAPVDLFISAAQKQMDALIQKDLINVDTKKNLLLNKVVLITPLDSKAGITSFEDCNTEKVSTLAIGDPASVPAGQYAQEVFNSLKIWDSVQKKANMASDVKEVLSWVETGNIDCGIVYATDAATSNKVKIVCEAPKGSHKGIIYPAALTKSAQAIDEAKAFLDYLSSDEASGIFKKYGFTMSN